MLRMISYVEAVVTGAIAIYCAQKFGQSRAFGSPPALESVQLCAAIRPRGELRRSASSHRIYPSSNPNKHDLQETMYSQGIKSYD
jgi:hypothetical protein